MDLQLEGKRALVTGGSRGIGRAAVLALARAGASVAAGYRSQSDDVESLREQLAGTGGDSWCIQADLADPAAAPRLVGDVVERLGGLDIIVNNAGVVSHRMLEDLDLEEWRRIIDTNLTAVYLVVQAAAPHLGEGSSIINVTSAVAMRGMPGRVHYGSSKAGVIGMTRMLCKELGPRGIRANAIAPGIIETDQVGGLTEEGRSRYAGLAALQRLGHPDDVAGAVLFLASDLSRFVSGVTLNVDGGI